MKILNLILAFSISTLFFGCSVKEPKLLTYEQNTTLYVKDIKPLHVKDENFFSHYFMPWSIEKLNVKKQKASWANFVFGKKDIYYAENSKLWKLKEIKKIIKTTNFSAYNSKLHYGLTTKNAQIRNLPTNKPFYKTQITQEKVFHLIIFKTLVYM